MNPEDLGRAAGAYRLSQAIHAADAVRPFSWIDARPV